jgi:hypothetical protein
MFLSFVFNSLSNHIQSLSDTTALILEIDSHIFRLPAHSMFISRRVLFKVASIGNAFRFLNDQFSQRIIAAFLTFFASINCVVIASVFFDLLMIFSANLLFSDKYHHWFHQSVPNRFKYIIFNHEFTASHKKNLLTVTVLSACIHSDSANIFVTHASSLEVSHIG